ncbi:putative Homocysteine-binding domain-containing protein [Plasmopara halstedii]
MTTQKIPSVTLLDGGTGEELFARGLADDRRIWSAIALVHEQHHNLLREVHMSFLDAGADCITSNNYGVTPGVGFSDEEIQRYTTIAGRVAREACDQWTAASLDPMRRKPKVCGSLPPLLESYRADRVPDHESGVEMYTLIAQTLNPFVDCYLAETLSSSSEAKMALLGVHRSRDGDKNMEIMVSFTLNSKGRLRSGEDLCNVFEKLISFSAHLTGIKLQAILFNCSQPEAICKALKELHENDHTRAILREQGVLLGAYANRLTIIPDDWALAEYSEPQAIRTDLAVEKYNTFILQWIELGVELVGGCCGIGPEYIASIHQMLKRQGRR